MSDNTIPDDLFLGCVGKVQYLPLKCPKRGEKGMNLFWEYIMSENEIDENDCMCFDQEKAFVTQSNTELMNNIGITYLIFPKELHELLSPADNNFHGAFKSIFYTNISSLSTSQLSHVKRLQIAALAYSKITDESVRNMFKHCGLTSGEDPNMVLDRLVNENQYYASDADHIKFDRQISVFLKWADEHAYADF